MLDFSIIPDILKKTKIENQGKNVQEKIKILFNDFKDKVEDNIRVISSNEHKRKPIVKSDKDFLNLIYHLKQVYFKTEQYLNESSKTDK